MFGAVALDQLHGVLDQPIEHREPILHTAGAPRQVDDEGRAADAVLLPLITGLLTKVLEAAD